MLAPASTQAQLAAASIMEGISSGRYAPGEKLNEVGLAAELEISRNTLREAFAMLTAQGLLSRLPNRGVFIAEPSVDTLREMYAARAVMEPGALLWGQRLGLERLEAVIARAEALRDAHPDLSSSNGMSSSEEQAIRTISDANHQFHRLIVASAGSPELDRSMDRILALMRLAFMHASTRNPAFHVDFIAKNRMVLDRITAADFPSAADTLARSLLDSKQALALYFR